MRSLARTFCLCTVLPALLSACGGEESHEFTDVRDRKAPRHQVPPNLSPEERLGLSPQTPPQRKLPITWTTPKGWEEYDAGSQMRAASWRVVGRLKSDCSLTLLPSGGGMAANVNRWRKEMNLEPLDPAAVAALPTRTMLGMDGTYIDFSGSFSGGRGGSGPITEARMLGVILEGPSAAVFVKFTGPAEVVSENKAAFESLVDSMVFDRAAAAGAPGAGTPTAEKLTWAAPQGWALQPPRPMREATFLPEDMPEGWCYIGLIGGGIEPNLNRWRGEMGQPPLSAVEIAAQPKIPFAGGEGVFQELTGSFRGTGGEPQDNATMFAFVAPRGPRMFVFVKMVGPSAKMGAQKERFLALCRSLD
jgi:hypothetical protein